jgi:hypothetical protein
LRTPNRNCDHANADGGRQHMNIAGMGDSEMSISISVWPSAGTPRTCLSWLAAIRMPEAVMKPAITGWLRKFARNPSLKTPSTTRKPPDRKASVSAAAA